MKAALIRTLPSRRVMGGNARLAHSYYAFGIVFLRRCYHQIFGPRRRLPEFANGFCRHGNARLHFDPHMTWQSTKSYVQRANAFGLVVHRVPPIWILRMDPPGTWPNTVGSVPEVHLCTAACRASTPLSGCSGAGIDSAFECVPGGLIGAIESCARRNQSVIQGRPGFGT